MLESFINIKKLNEKPYLIFLWAVVLASAGVLISNYISFQVRYSGVTFDMTGFFSVLFTLIPSVYFMTLLIKKEERVEEKLIKKFKKKSFWEMHGFYVIILLMFFVGLTLTFAFWSFVLPENAFQSQISKINEIRGVSGAVTQIDTFFSIVNNNLQVMIFSFIFSFIFGAGAIFIIIWNASVLGVFIGQLSKGLSILHIPLVSFGFWGHGIPEIVGYLFAALAGGILSAAIIRKNSTEILRRVGLDSLKLFIVAVLFIFMAGFIEVFL